MRRSLVIGLVLAVFGGAWILVSSAYRPRGAAAVRAKLDRARQALQSLDLQLQAEQDKAKAERARLTAEVRRLSRELGNGAGASPEKPGSSDQSDPLDRSDRFKEGEEVRLNVGIQVLCEAPIRDVLTLPGVVEAQEDILLPAKNDGTLEWIGAKEGEAIHRGQVLAKIDAAKYVEELSRAKAAEQLARVNLKRIENLVRQKVASPQELDRAQSEWEQATAAVGIARQSLSDSTLVSPIDGVLDDWVPDPGEFVNRGAALAHVVDASKVKVCVDVPEKDIAFLRVGQPSRVQNPEPVGGYTTGTISRIRLVAEEQSKTFRVEVLVDNARRVFRPGMIARVELVRRSNDNAIVVPFFAVMETQDGPVVFVESGGKAQARRVSIGIRQGMMLEVTQGLRAGDRLIVSGQRALSDGAAVRVVERKS